MSNKVARWGSFTNDHFQLMFNRRRVLHCKIEILNRQDMIIGGLEGIVTGGSITISNDNMVRRSLDISFVANKTIEIQPHSLLWLDKRLKAWIGVEDVKGEIQYFNQGIYIISNPETSVSVSGRTITIKAFDKMHLFAQPFKFETKFNVGTPIHEAIKAIANLLGETKLIIESSEFTMPYDMQLAIGSDMQNALKDITNLYMNYQIYYNLDGFLVFEKMKNRVYDIPVWEFKDDMDFTISRTMISDYENIKNYIKCVGKLNDDTGIQPMYEIKIQGSDKTFSIENIGERATVITEDKYTEEEQCKKRCEYEIEKTQNLINTFSITSVPIYIINDVNRIIKVYDNDQEYICLIDGVTVPLSYDGTMQIECHQIFS